MDFSAGLQTVVTAFLAVPGIETASTDPAMVTAPGVWVQLVGMAPDTLAGWELDVQAWLTVTDSDGGPGPAAQLSTLLTACYAAGITADDKIIPRSVQLPTNPAPLPALIIPLTVRINA